MNRAERLKRGIEPGALVTEARLEEEINRVSEGCEKVLQGFQNDLTAQQHTSNQVNNVVNVFIRAMVNKFGLTEEDLRKAGEEIWQQAMFNADVTKAAVNAGQRVDVSKLKKSPMEDVHRVMGAVHAAEMKKARGGQGS